MATSIPQSPGPVPARRDRALLFDGRGRCARTAAAQLMAVRYDGTGLERVATLDQNDIGVVRGKGQRDVAVCPRFLAGLGATRRADVSRVIAIDRTRRAGRGQLS